jgi:hypothetical protein
VVLLVAVCVSAAAVVGAAVATDPAATPPVTELRLTVDGGADRVTLRHAGGDAIRPESIRLRIRIEGTALQHQPPVPFFAARGFRGGPTGPFNPATEGAWRTGQTGTLRLASTNRPLPAPGDRVTVTVATERAVLAKLSATAT